MILLSRPLYGYLAGTVIQLPTSTELALVAQGYGSFNAGPVTAGPVAINGTIVPQGRVAIPAAGISVVVSHTGVTAESKIFAVIAQAAADTTATGGSCLKADLPWYGDVKFTSAAGWSVNPDPKETFLIGGKTFGAWKNIDPLYREVADLIMDTGKQRVGTLVGELINRLPENTKT